ncbi:MAG: hypothetical protein AB2826_21450 [Candidatus Thiodiazotropha sp.]
MNNGVGDMEKKDNNKGMTEDEFAIVPYIQIVPGGYDAAKGILRAVAVISPDRVVGETAKSGLDLRTWPSGLVEKIKDGFGGEGFSIPIDIVVATKADAGKKPCPDPSKKITVYAEAQRLKQVIAQEKDYPVAANKIWQDSLAPTLKSDDGHWSSLAELLASSLSGSRTTAGKIEEVKNEEGYGYNEPSFGKDGQLATKHPPESATKVDAVMAVEHSLAAVSLEMRRAEEICESLAQENNVEDAPGAKSPLSKPPWVDRKLLHETFRVKQLTQYLTRKDAASGWIGEIGREKVSRRKILDQFPYLEIQQADSPEERERKEDKIAELILSTERREAKKKDHKQFFKDTNALRMESAELYQKEMQTRSDPHSERPDLTAAWSRHKVNLHDPDNRDEGLRKALRSHLYATWPQFEDEDGSAYSLDSAATDQGTEFEKQQLESEQALKDAARDFFTLQSTPTLARLVALNIDLEIPLKPLMEKLATLDSQGEWDLSHDDDLPDCPKLLTALLFISSPVTGRLLGETGNRQAGARPVPWVLSKLRLDNGNAPRHFLPALAVELATFNEKALREKHLSKLSQFDGHIVMSSSAGTAGGRRITRFDMTSLDPRMALELEGQRMLVRQEMVLARQEGLTEARLGVDEGGEDTWEQLAHGATFDTAGAVLLDRMANGVVTKKLAGRAATCDGGCAELTLDDGSRCIVLDADDLSVGFRVDIGVPVRGGESGSVKTEWFSNSNRKIKYGTDGTHKYVEKYLRHLAGRQGSPERLALDRALSGNQSRVLPHTEEGVDIIVDEEVDRFTAEPKALSPGAAAPNQSKSIPDNLPLGRQLSLPTGGKDSAALLPLPLRIGMPLRFDMMPTYSGGIAADTGSIESVDCRLQGKVAFPPGDTDDALPYIRMLRQHRLDAPVTLIGKWEAEQPWLTGASAAPLMVVRSIVHEDSELDALKNVLTQPDSMERYVFPPVAGFEKAMLHGVLDDYSSEKPRPNGAFPRIWFKENEKENGFKVVTTRFRKGFDGQPFMRADEIRDIEVLPKTGEQEADKRYGDPVLELQAHGPYPTPERWHQSDYFPDPNAEKLVIGIRRADEARYLPVKDADKLVLDFVGRSEYPKSDMLKVVLKQKEIRNRQGKLFADDLVKKKYNIVRCKHAKGDEKWKPCIDDGSGYCWPYEDSWCDVPDRIEDCDKESLYWGDAGDSSDASKHKCNHEITLNLGKGESFEVDFWCVPSARQLARESALLQALAIYVGGDCKRCSSEAAITGLRKIIDDSEPEIAAELAGLMEKAGIGKDPEDPGFFAPGSYITPPPSTLLKIAECVHRIMLRRPIRELAAVETIRVVHAVEAPLEIPELCGPGATSSDHMETAAIPPLGLWKESCLSTPPKDFEAHCLSICRPSDDLHQSVHHNGSKDPSSIKVFSERIKSEGEIAEGSTNVVLSGDLSVDLETTSGIELSVRTVLPGSSVFDNADRGRSLAGKRSGSWPERRDGSKTSGKRNAEEIFGFSLKRNGVVSHATSEATLLRVDDLPRDPAKLSGSCTDESTGFTRFNVQRFFLQDDGRQEGWHVSARHIFPDGKARLLEVTPKAISRTLEHMTTVRHFKDGVFHLAEAVPDEYAFTSGKVQQVILPATIRPAKPKARSPVPSFSAMREIAEEEGAARKLTLTLGAMVRIPLGREWFSSGMFEQLGIVVWPPSLSSGDEEDLNQDIVPVDVDGSKEKLDIRDVIDQDFGPGGQFLTRLGADPIRRAKPAFETIEPSDNWLRPGVLLPLSAFKDLKLADGDRKKARFTGNLRMPFGSETSTAEKIRPSETIEVGIVYYEPLFDPESEEWYVDVALDSKALCEPFVRFGLVRYQPCTRKDLCLSRPDVQWAQLRPERKVEAEIDQEKLVVTVSGAASRGAKRLGRKDGEPQYLGNGGEYGQPRMKFRIFLEDGESGEGVMTRNLRDVKEVCPNETFGTGENSDSSWKYSIGLEGIFLPGDTSTAKCVVYVEELDYRRPAEYADESALVPSDLSIADKDTFVASGPRFAAKLDLSPLLVDRSIEG